jgi:hypothetical protein
MELFKNLPPWAKGAIAVTVTVGLVGGVYFTVKKIKDSIEDRNRRDESKAVEDELSKLNNNSATKQKLVQSSIESIANIIETSANGMGTDYWAISTQINRLKNDADFLALQKAFGTRTINSGVYLVPDFKGNLSQVLRDEMSADEVLDLNKLLSKKGIKYRL